MRPLEFLPAGAADDPFRLRIGLLVGSLGTVSGGVGEAVSALARALARTGEAQVEVFTLRHADEAVPELGAIPVHSLPFNGPASFGFAAGLSRRLKARDIDVLHVHGLWMYQSVAALHWARSTKLPYLVSPHGMLDPWALRNSRVRKLVARYLYEDRHLARAGLLHALCAGEADAIRLAGVKTPVAVIPNGVAPAKRCREPASWRAALGDNVRVLLFLGRVTAKKQVLELIEAWARLRDEASGWHLVVIGPAEPAYFARLKQAVAESGLSAHIHLLPPAYGDARAAAYASADAFILPSLSEGLPMAVLEAFAAGLPALLTPQCNLPEAFAHGCALPIGTSVAEIATGLRQFFAMPAETLQEMGRRGARLAAEEYDWDVVARRFLAVYGKLAVRG